MNRSCPITRSITSTAAAALTVAAFLATGSVPVGAHEGPANFNDAKALAVSKKSLLLVDFGSPT